MPAATPLPVVNAFTVDVEDYFQVSAFERHIPRHTWDQQVPRVEASTERLLATLARHRVLGTFFTLGWVAERYPALIKRIVTIGEKVGDRLELATGVKAGERVAANPRGKLSDGVRVQLEG